jgi:hypothetical protein
MQDKTNPHKQPEPDSDINQETSDLIDQLKSWEECDDNLVSYADAIKKYETQSNE